MKHLAWLLVGLLGFCLAAYALVQGDRIDEDELERMVEVLRIEPGDAVADVGAGDGRFSVALASVVGASGRIYATEVDRNDLKKIRERVEREGARNVSVVEGSQEELGLDPACCDAVLLRRVYHHFQKPVLMREGLRASLRDDGLLLVVDFDTRRQWSRPRGIPESRDGHGISQELLVSEMAQAGFELVNELEWPNGDYALVFRVAVID